MIIKYHLKICEIWLYLEQIIKVITDIGGLKVIDISEVDNDSIKKIFKVPNTAVPYVVPTLHIVWNDEEMEIWRRRYSNALSNWWKI